MVSVGKRISILRNANNLKQGELAAKLGVAQSKVSKWESDTHPPKAEDLQRLAVLFNMEPKDILGFGAIDPGAGRKIEVMGELQAGEFNEAIEWDHDQRYFVTVPLDKDLESLPMQGYVVKGPSMNRIYPEGSIVYITPVHALDDGLLTGDIVMVMRRDKHGMVEGTLKEYVEEDGHKWLWPRSSHPEHQTPIDYSKGRNGDIEEVIIVGVVMAALVKSRRR
jgi:transcriptional regulator with XRE-family HTH domain